MNNIAGAVAGADQATIRRRFHEYHSRMRNEGLGPVEAVTLLADQLVAAIESGEIKVEEGSSTADWLSLAFQEFIADDSRATFGQYLTPMPVAQHLTELLGRLDSESLVLDPFMGSGILLDAVADANSCRTLGIEINPAVAHVGRASVRLSGHRFDMAVGDAFTEWAEGRIPQVDVVVMNPPFGAQATQLGAERLLETTTAALTGRGAPPVELLAIELALSVVRPGGMVAAILPQSVLTNGRYARLRAEIFSRSTLRHVTYLPDSTFIPFRGVARACVLMLENTPSRLPYPATIFEPKSIGYDDTGRPDGDADLSPVPTALATVAVEATGDLTRQEAAEGVRFGDVAEVFRGRNPARDQYVEQGAFLLKVGSLAGSFISWRARRRSQVPPEWAFKNDKYRLRSGDICFTGTAHRPTYIGLKIDLVSELPEQGAVPSGEVIVVRLKPDAPYTPEALLYYLRSADGYRQLQSRIRGSSAHIYPKDIVEMRIPDLNAVLDVPTITRLHEQAEAAFRTYLSLEDEIATIVVPPDVDD